MPLRLLFSPATASLMAPGLAAWLLGTALQLQQARLFDGLIYALLLLFGIACMRKAWAQNATTHGRVLWVSVAMALLAFGVTGLRASVFLTHALDPALEGRDVAVVGVISSMPQRNETGLRFRFEVESAQAQGQVLTLPDKLDLSWYAGVFRAPAQDGTMSQAAELARPPAPLQAGERWQFTVRLKAPHGARNPHGFDYELWLWLQGVQATGYVRASPKDPAPQRLVQTGWHPVERVRQAVRDQIFEQVEDRSVAGLIAALVVGDQQAIERVDWDVFRATGVAHLMAISGLHITMFAWLAALLVGWLWRRSRRLCLALPAPTAALLGGVLLATAYALFSGWGVPSQRTVLMLATVAVLRLTGKRWPWPATWLLACAVVVAVDPWALLQAGFWLSFVAVGILFATGSDSTGTHGTGARGRLVSMFRQQWVITLALTPLTLLLFGQVSVVGLAANALAIPWVTLVVTPLAMLGVAVPALWDVTAWAMALLTGYLQWLAALPFATVSIAQAPLWAGAVGLLGGALLTMPMPWTLRSLGLPLILPVLLWQAPRPPTGQFDVLAADIGQGNAVLVRTAHHALLYDAGPRFSLESDAGHRVLVPLLRAQGTNLDMLLLSHRDSDHAGGALAVLTMQPEARLVSSIGVSHELQAVRPVTRCEAGQRWQWDGVEFEVLHPTAADYERAGAPNSLSCTLRISNGAQTVLLVGDIEQAQEARLVAQGTPLKADVLLVPHHGSKTSSSAVFLDAVKPRFALVQSGYRNRFGHPAPSVLVRYAERQIEVLDSPHCGAMHWQSAQPMAVKCERQASLRYWHHRVP